MTKKSASNRKGRLLERVVALLHDVPGLEVQRNVDLACADGSGDTREIDVLLSSSPGGYRVRMPIECKNYSSPVGPRYIDEFVGKLRDVGIPPSLGIYVTVNGYTRGAIRRAVKAGVRPLVLHGLSADRLTSTVSEAFRYVVYLLPEVGFIQVFDDSKGSRCQFQALSYETGKGGLKEIIINNAWRHWFEGTIPKEIGCHLLYLEVPPGASDEGHSKRFGLHVNVIAAVAETAGSATRHELRHAVEGSAEKTRTEAEFDRKRPAKVRLFPTEKKLQSFLSSKQGSPRLVIGRVPLPRVMYDSFYWPVSEESARKAEELVRNGEEPSFEAVEGLDLSAAWVDFILQGYSDELAAHEIDWGLFPRGRILRSGLVPEQKPEDE